MLSVWFVMQVIQCPADISLYCIGYSNDITEIMKSLPKTCKGFLMSATLSPELNKLKHVVLHHHQDLYSSGMDDMYGSVHVTYPWLKTVEQLEIADSSGDATIGISESFAVSDWKPTPPPIYFAAPPTHHCLKYKPRLPIPVGQVYLLKSCVFRSRG